jgi:hypothetical protein
VYDALILVDAAHQGQRRSNRTTEISPTMRAADMFQRFMGFLLGLISGFILIFGSLVAIPSLFRIWRMRSM